MTKKDESGERQEVEEEETGENEAEVATEESREIQEAEEEETAIELERKGGKEKHKHKSTTKTDRKRWSNKEKKLVPTHFKKPVEEDEERAIELKGLKEKEKKSDRKRWSNHEKKLVLTHFKKHVKTKTAPKKNECLEFINKNLNMFSSSDWARVKTLVYNTYRTKYTKIYYTKIQE